MIISQTPYRVSFAGGGTDLPAFYRSEYGAVLSVALQRHMYVTVGPRFDKTVRVAYTRTEITDDLENLKHELIRESLKLVGLDKHIEITTIGDLPESSGMGSSSTLTVGVLHALYAYRGMIANTQQLAQEACRIEIDILGKPIGKQDQFAAAYGGCNYIRFNPDDTVDVEPVPVRRETLEELESRVLLFYTNVQRSADTILEKQSAGTAQKMDTLRRMRDLAEALRPTLAGEGDLEEFSRLLHEGWLLKRSLGFGISQKQVDDWYEAARRNGATGGKLLGAGGGGFLLLTAPPEKHGEIRAALGHPAEAEFRVDRRGTRIIFISDGNDPKKASKSIC